MIWREKYRPNKIEDLAGCEKFKASAREWLAKGTLPSNMLYVGPPGTGKTSAAIALAKDLYGEYFDRANFIVTNASDDRGIDFVRELKHMVKQKGLGVRRKIYVLDEADSLTPAAQKALRQVMEDSHRTAIFILTANDIGPIHNAIRDRCVIFNFKPVDLVEGEKRLLFIHNEEGLPSKWKEQYRSLLKLCNGSLRQCIDVLQSIPKTSDALSNHLRRDTQSLNKAAIGFAGGNYSSVASFLKEDLRKGSSKIGTLKGLRFRVKNLLESEEEWYAFMLTYGEFIMMANMWPDDDESFVDYFIAKLKENKER
jgi:DNA polymerase III delta prime subunit